MRSDLSKSLDSRAERGDHFLPIAHAPGSHLMGIPAFSGKPKKSCTMLYPNTASEAIGLLVYYLYRRNGPYGWKFCFNMVLCLPHYGQAWEKGIHGQNTLHFQKSSLCFQWVSLHPLHCSQTGVWCFVLFVLWSTALSR